MQHARLALAFSSMFGLFACDGGAAPDPDAGMMDAGTTDAGGADAGADAGSVIDAGPVFDYCVPYATTLSSEGGGLGGTIGQAVGVCGRGACLNCALDRGVGPDCGPGETMASCIADCFERNNFGACDAAGACDPGFSCDGTNLCRHDAITAVNDAVDGGDIDLDCLGCYTAITECIAVGNCSLMCASAGCGCDTCQCGRDCPAAFAACSGLPPHLDCAEVAAMCD